MATDTATAKNIGHVTQVIGSTFDVEFSEENLPDIYNAVRAEQEFKGVKVNVVGEVQQHLGGGRVRCVALGSTDGMVRGMEIVDTGGSRFGCRSARKRSAASSTCSANRSTVVETSVRKNAGRFTAIRRSSKISPRRPRCSRPASRWSTC